MELRPGRRLTALAIIQCAACLLLSAQPYTIDWSTIDGGGGSSAGGTYTVRGTIGQPDAGATMTGGSYSLTGGFWTIQLVQVPGAPLLSIKPAGPGMASVSWSPDPGGWVLQETSTIQPPNWADSASGSANPITVPATGLTKYYRLNKP